MQWKGVLRKAKIIRDININLSLGDDLVGWKIEYFTKLQVKSLKGNLKYIELCALRSISDEFNFEEKWNTHQGH